MPELRPFRALRYDSRAVGDVGAVLCPPYDVISADDRARLSARHARNAIHLELPDSYAEAARLFAAWQADGTLRRDDRPMIYVYRQAYRVAATSRAASGFFCRLRVEDYGPGVRRHERTHAGPKEDRLQLLRTVRANVSPVLMLYEDGDAGSSEEAVAELTNEEPTLRAADHAGNTHSVWAVDPSTSPAAHTLLQLAGAGPLTIADGHHRYETALRYAEERPRADTVLVLLYEASSGGLSVLPTHRLLRGPLDAGSVFDAAASAGFQVRRVARRELFTDDGRLDFPATGLGVLTGNDAAVLSIDDTGAAALLGSDAAVGLRRLPVAVLDAALERWTGRPVTDLVAQDAIMYSKDARAAVDQVQAGDAEVAFLLPPTPIAAVLEVAAEGDVMPQKSTYFEPKAATGLVFSLLDDD